MKYATDELGVVKSKVLDVDPNIAEGSLEMYFIESQMTTVERTAMKPYVDRRILKGIFKAVGMERTDLLERFLVFQRKVAGIDFIVSFDTWLTADFCKDKEITVVTESLAVSKLCGMWNVPVISSTSFGYNVTKFGYAKMKVRRGI